LEFTEKRQIEGKKKKETVTVQEHLNFSDIDEARIVISFK
jgi:hypothetical protein